MYSYIIIYHDLLHKLSSYRNWYIGGSIIIGLTSVSYLYIQYSYQQLTLKVHKNYSTFGPYTYRRSTNMPNEALGPNAKVFTDSFSYSVPSNTLSPSLHGTDFTYSIFTD